MEQVDIRIFLHHDDKVNRINGDNEWLAALLSGEAFKEKKPPVKEKKVVASSPQRRAIRGS